MFKRSHDVVRLDYSGRYTYGDNDVFLSLTMPDVLPPWCRARKCKHFAALTVSPICRQQ